MNREREGEEGRKGEGERETDRQTEKDTLREGERERKTDYS